MSSSDTGPRSGPKNLENGPSSTGNMLRELAGLEDAPSHHDTEDLTGAVFGRFRIKSVLGAGGMGVVYLAEDAALARQVALKVLGLDVAEDPEHRQRLLREARASAALSHPNIAAVYEMGEVDGRLYIAMERIIGESLRARLDKGPLPHADALGIAKQILRGVAKAHEAGIVHRDIKPDNIMVATDGTVKVLDFGIAKFLADPRQHSNVNSSATEHGRLLGTPSYMSPEQANAAPIDARSDVFSFGIVFYEMLAGKTPFAGKTFLDILAALARDTPRPLSEINPAISKDLEALVGRCLRKTPDERYSNASEVLDALEALVHRDAKLESHEPRPSTRRRMALAAIATALVSFGVAGVFWYSNRRQAPASLQSTSHSTSASPSASAAAPVATPITAHPPPKSDNEAALAAYREGLQGLRDGAYAIAHVAFSRAVELDPALGAAYVRLIITSIWYAPSPEDVRRAYRKAISHRMSLAERDRLLLDSLEPIVMREPPDTEEGVKRLREASEKYPGDVELLATRSITIFAPNVSPATQLDLSDQCLALDPLYADCWQPRATALFRLGRLSEAVAATNHCVKVSPAANDCLSDRMDINATFGRCDEMADDAKRIIANEPNDWNGHRSLATALLAQGRSPAAVRATLDNGQAMAPAGPRERWARFDNIHFALFEGRFGEVERTYLDWQPKEDKNPFDEVHRTIAQDLVVLYEALGRTKDAAKIADNYLSTREVWRKGFVRSIWNDPTIWFLKKKLDAGIISKDVYVRERATWIQTWENRVAPDMQPIVWFQAFAFPAETPEEAKEALATRPELKPLEYYRKRPTMLYHSLGNVYLLAGQPADAARHLSHAAVDCRVIYEPIENTLSHYRLAKARDQLGDKQNACRSYGIVLERWGKSHSNIPVVDDARKRFQKLACKAP